MPILKEPATIDGQRSIPPHEFEFRVSRAGGPGGQHVNKTSTRVQLKWRPSLSAILTDDEKARIARTLARRIDATGAVLVVASSMRSQLQNRIEAERRLLKLIRGALSVRKQRTATTPTRSSVERRLTAKKLESRKKQERRRVSAADDV
ncbi:MAG: alternative ribosome rescue aminoacyl-tRNA hydrolase ArfB [Gemmatimonadota bacterium]